MNTTQKDTCTSIGYLFYSFASSEGKVDPAELNKFKEQIHRYWSPLANCPGLGNGTAHCITISFDHARDQGMDTDAAFARFLQDYQDHPARFAPMKERALKTASAIAYAREGMSKTECFRLSQLQVLFKE